jgi:hypothetical protein
MDEDQKQWYDDVDEYLSEFGRWWIEDFDKLDKDMKVRFIERYRLTIASCLFSDTYNYETLMSAFGVTAGRNPVGDRGTKSAHSGRPLVRCFIVGRSSGHFLFAEREPKVISDG